jgi:U4/U6 small nuclear ribonucleoprotein PRP4
MASELIIKGIEKGNINLAGNALTQRSDLDEISLSASRAHSQVVLQLEVQRLARFAAAPTEPEEVKRRLRMFGKPVTLFGEGPADRRERLKRNLAEEQVQEMIKEKGVGAVVESLQQLQASGLYSSVLPPSTLTTGSSSSSSSFISNIAPSASAPEAPPELFYTPAKPELIRSRKEIALFSFDRAAKRLRTEMAIAKDTSFLVTETDHAIKVIESVKRVQPSLSQAGDDRPMSCCAFGNNGELIATGSWGPTIKIWTSEEAELLATLRGHTERIVGLAWTPSSSLGITEQQRNQILLDSASADGTAKLWDLSSSSSSSDPMDKGMSSSSSKTFLSQNSSCMSTLSGHSARLSSIAFHPSGRFVGTTSYDKTWKLWDVETSSSILTQEGHAKEVYPIVFHPDGSLVATGDLSGIGRIWDLRSGKSIFILRGHSSHLLGLDWSPNGFHIASASEDHSSIVWEIRQQRTLYTIPAHTGMVSRVKFAPISGEFLVTSSFDGTVKVWSGRDCSLLNTLKGHDGKVVGLDVSIGDETTFVTCGSDRTFKVWKS